MLEQPLIARIASAIALAGNTDQRTIVGAPNVWMGKGHKGQPPARGIIVGLAALSDPKTLSKRDVRRYFSKKMRNHLRTRPDFSAQIAQEKKAARGRNARIRAAGN